MKVAEIQQYYAELQGYVGWTKADEQRLADAATCIRPHIPEIIADFYDTILKHQRVASVITGGQAQVDRLKGTLALWIEQLLSGPYDDEYVGRRAAVGLKHVEIGLHQVYTCAALARLRSFMTSVLLHEWRGSPDDRGRAIAALNRLLDLDLAVITAVYESERREREKALLASRLESALQQEKNFAESLLAHAPAAVLVLNPAGNILRINPFLEQLSGYTARQVQGRGWLEVFLAPEDRLAAHAALVEPLLTSSTQPAQGERTADVIARDEARRTVRWSSTALRSAAGDVYAVLIVGLDVTDLLNAQEQLLQSSRLATIGQVVAGLAHESRNALQRIQAAAEMLELEVAGQPDALKFVHRIEQAQTHLHRLFDEVRGYAGPIHLDLTPCRLRYLWREAWDLIADQRKGRDIVLADDSHGDIEIYGDQFRLVQVFRNIFENALAACSDPVRVEIKAEQVAVGDQRFVRVRLLDNGPGISAQARHKVFEPFFTTKPKGTGLGMAIAQRVVEAHEGTIELGNAPSGAEFVLTLPLPDDATKGGTP